MIIEDINELREKLDRLIVSNAPYEEIYNLSVRIDKLLIAYYKKDAISKNLA